MVMEERVKENDASTLVVVVWVSFRWETFVLQVGVGKVESEGKERGGEEGEENGGGSFEVVAICPLCMQETCALWGIDWLARHWGWEGNHSLEAEKGRQQREACGWERGGLIWAIVKSRGQGESFVVVKEALKET